MSVDVVKQSIGRLGPSTESVEAGNDVMNKGGVVLGRTKSYITDSICKVFIKVMINVRAAGYIFGRG